MNAMTKNRPNESLVSAAIGAIERGMVPDAVTRWGIRRLCRQRLAMLPHESERTAWNGPSAHPWKTDFMAMMDASPIAMETEAANEQHYELPPEFFTTYLGPRRKYSACTWSKGATDIATAEQHSLEQVCQRAEIADGMRILDLGCGWGSFTLWALEHFPNCRLTSVSNSAPQREFIISEAKRKGWDQRLEVITADMNHFEPAQQMYDRTVSIEMFEHMRNYRQLLEKVRSALRPDGKLFVHIFCHKEWPYLFETEGSSNWMGRYFFTGGMMPSYDQLGQFQQIFKLENHWEVNGVDYGRTLDAWLEQFDRQSVTIDRILQDTYGSDWGKWKQRWRVFMMASSELFRYAKGKEWFVGHYLLSPTH